MRKSALRQMVREEIERLDERGKGPWAQKFSQLNDMELEDVIEAALLEYVELFDAKEAEQLCREILKRA